MDRTIPEVGVVIAWHEALNRGDRDRLAGLSHPEIALGGPRDSGHGTQLLREWMDRANIHLEPRRVFHKTNTVVVEQEAEWRSAETGETDGGQVVASVFSVGNGLVESVVRHPDLTGALDAAGLDLSDEVKPGHP